jgi:hypothetical protein
MANPENVRNLAGRRSCAIVGCGQGEWMAEAAAARTGAPLKTISDAAAAQSHSIVGSAQAGWFQFQLLYSRIVKEQPDLLDC